MQEISWSETVNLRVGDDLPYEVSGPRQAIDALMSVWPERYGDGYDDALRQCRKAVDGEDAPSASRAAFVKAAFDAGLAVD